MQDSQNILVWHLYTGANEVYYRKDILRINGSTSITIATVVSRILVNGSYYSLHVLYIVHFILEAAIFCTVLFNSFSALLEFFSLYEARSIVEKHKTYAFYHPSLLFQLQPISLLISFRIYFSI